MAHAICVCLCMRVCLYTVNTWNCLFQCVCTCSYLCTVCPLTFDLTHSERNMIFFFHWCMKLNSPLPPCVHLRRCGGFRVRLSAYVTGCMYECKDVLESLSNEMFTINTLTPLKKTSGNTTSDYPKACGYITSSQHVVWRISQPCHGKTIQSSSITEWPSREILNIVWSVWFWHDPSLTYMLLFITQTTKICSSCVIQLEIL